MNILPKPTEEELLPELFGTDMCHLRDVWRVFDKHINLADKSEHPLILDVGCKSSELKPLFAKKGFSWLGVDIAPEDPRVFRADMHNLPFEDSSVNMLFCSHALEHSENPLQALREMIRVVRMGGILFIATPIHCDYHLFQCDKTHIIVPTEKQMQRLFDYLGIQTINIDLWNVEGQDEKYANLISIGRVVK